MRTQLIRGTKPTQAHLHGSTLYDSTTSKTKWSRASSGSTLTISRFCTFLISFLAFLVRSTFSFFPFPSVSFVRLLHLWAF